MGQNGVGEVKGGIAKQRRGRDKTWALEKTQSTMIKKKGGEETKHREGHT